MNQRHRRQLETIDRHIRQLERLKTLAAHAWHACELTNPDGYPGGGTERTSGGDTSRPTEASYLAIEGRIESKLRRVQAVDDDGKPVTREVPVFDDDGRPVLDEEGERVTRTEPVFEDEARRVGMAAVENSLAVIGGAITEAHAELSILAAPLTRRDPPKRTNMVDCEACDRPVANTPDDRLRSGYCTACYHAWRRQGMPDRVQFERNRPKHGGDRVRIGTRDDGRHQSIELTYSGATIQLPPHLAAEFTQLSPDDQILELQRFHETAVSWWEKQV